LLSLSKGVNEEKGASGRGAKGGIGCKLENRRVFFYYAALFAERSE